MEPPTTLLLPAVDCTGVQAGVAPVQKCPVIEAACLERIAPSTETTSIVSKVKWFCTSRDGTHAGNRCRCKVWESNGYWVSYSTRKASGSRGAKLVTHTSCGFYAHMQSACISQYMSKRCSLAADHLILVELACQQCKRRFNDSAA